MKQRNSNHSRISLNTSNKRKVTKRYERIVNGVEDKQRRVEYEKRKKEDTDTNERVNIHFEIKRLIGYGLPQQEIVERLTEKFADSKYQMFFKNWVDDQYKKGKQMNHSREDESQR